MDFEILKSYGLVTFVIVSVMGGAAWVLRIVMLHFIDEIKEFRNAIKVHNEERIERDKLFTGAIDRGSSSLQNIATQIMNYVDRNTLEHKDITQTQAQILDFVRKKR